MLRLFLSEEGHQSLSCPKCERELLPAYETEDGLEVAYWEGFDPGDVETGILVCGNFSCDHEEPVIFATDRDDSVVISVSETVNRFTMENADWISIDHAEEIAQALEHNFGVSGWLKLKAAAEYYRQIIEERQERIEGFIQAAGNGHKVSVTTEDTEYTGRIHSAESEDILLEQEDGEMASIPIRLITREMIFYPRKPRPRRENKEPTNAFVLCQNHQFFVVDGFHLMYGQREDDGRILGSTTDPVAAAALRLVQVNDALYFKGYFIDSEVQRFYWQRNYAKVKGHWVEDNGRTTDDKYAYIRTEDPAIAEELELDPVYAMVWAEYGTQDGDVVAYSGMVPAEEVEETRWVEEINQPDY